MKKILSFTGILLINFREILNRRFSDIVAADINIFDRSAAASSTKV
jgi:hypothetical protein